LISPFTPPVLCLCGKETPITPEPLRLRGYRCFFFRQCSHQGVNDKSKINNRKKNNVKFIIASKNTAKSPEPSKKPLNLIALFV